MPNAIFLVYAYGKHSFLKKNRHTGPLRECAALTQTSLGDGEEKSK